MSEAQYKTEAQLRELGNKVVQAAIDAAKKHRGGAMDRGIPAAPTVNPSDQGQPVPDLDALARALSDVPDRFASFAGPTASFSLPLGELAAVRQSLTGSIKEGNENSGTTTHALDQKIVEEGGVPTAGFPPPYPAISDNNADVVSALTGWAGHAAVQFTKYMKHCDDAVARQTDVARLLAAGLCAHRDLIAASSKAVTQIATETINVLDAGGSGECGPSGKVALTIVSDLAWLGAAATSEAPPVAFAMTFLAVASNRLTTVMKDVNHVVISGHTVLSIVDSMRAALGDVVHGITKAQDALAEGLYEAGLRISDEYNKHQLAPARLGELIDLPHHSLRDVKDNFYMLADP